MRILITGSSGMIGQRLIRLYDDTNIDVRFFDKEDIDLLDDAETNALFETACPTHVLHLATWSGGISWNRKYGSETFEKTTRIGLNVLHACQKYKVKKVLSIISSCAYPDLGNSVLKEADFWNGLPNETIRCHGLAKRNLVAYSLELRKQGMSANCAVLQNCYGPKDRFDAERSKVVAALIKKVVEAKEQQEKNIICFGDGSPLRELIYVDDAAFLIDRVLQEYDSDQLINITSGQETSIKDLVIQIANLVGYQGEILWDTSKPNGQMRKALDSTRMKEILGEHQFTTLETGLCNTISWYLNNKDVWNK